jgi:aminopeptidase N
MFTQCKPALAFEHRCPAKQMMEVWPTAGKAMLLALLSACSSAAMPQVHHTLQVSLEPDRHHLVVVDKVTLRQDHRSPLRFRLHAGLNPQVVEPGAELRPSPVKKVASLLPQNPQVPLEQFLVSLPKGTNEFTLRYGGKIHHAISQLASSYARSFQTSPGLISPEGVFLGGPSYWYPRFDDELVTFSLGINLPSGWHSVSQGKRTDHVEAPDGTHEAWGVDSPQEEIYLVAGELTEYARSAETVAAMVFLRQPDHHLAEKYLEATAQYLALYESLIGSYPYPKFALVENSWETGYGMPSFTLLGPKVIRLPFIPYSSYPHEILHNWWGNGVYVDESSGNWAEGLTSYLADHLTKEQRGQAVEYRRDTLQRYTNYVREARDFPLTAFRGRHDATTEAVGYGKTLMLFHMLRQRLGDATFIRGLQELYRRHRFKVIGFHHVAETFKAVAGESLAGFFEQWVERTGAPSLRVAAPKATLEPTGFRLTAELEQLQPGAPYRQLQIPVAVHLEGKDFAYQTRITMDRKRTTLDLPLAARPFRLEIDPEFDVFRRLNRSEIPPALGEGFGAEHALAVLPASAPPQLRQGYRNLAESWQHGKPEHLAITLDCELTELPSDQSVWLFGWENRFRDALTPALAGYRFADRGDRLILEDSELLLGKHSVVVAARRPENPANALTLLATERVGALPGLARKLPHYGKYSYLGFAGDEPHNVVKGQWPVVDSPLSVVIEQGDGQKNRAGKGKLAPRAPLAKMPPSPSAARMARDIAKLAASDMAGRGLGTPELDHAATFIANEFAAAGLQPGGDAGEGYYQPWTAEIGKPGRTVKLANVIGILPGGNPRMARESVVIGAHYDHLGRGGPNARQVDQGKIHPGADDNASGVAVLLELARRLGKTASPERTLVFIAFTAEEAGRLGSQHYLHGTRPYPTEAIMGMINLDTVGRLRSRELLVLGSGSAKEWEPIFRGAGYVTGVAVKPIAHDFGSSDQKSFHDVGIPAVQLFAGTHPDFHRPTDTADKIDSAGLLKVLKVLSEAAEYLGSRPDSLTTALAAAAATGKETKSVTSEGRRVLLGTVPEFAYSGQGVRLSGVTLNSPAATSGLKKDDILVEINGETIHHLPDLAKVLRSLEPGAFVRIRFLRDGTSRQTTAHVVRR